MRSNPAGLSYIDMLRGRIEAYVRRVESTEIDITAPTGIVRAPVEAGVSRFIDVQNLPSLESLPFIPERMRDFAFRYATEYKPHKLWAKEYGVSLVTIEKWLRHEGVRAYIAVCRYEQRMFNLAHHTIMQRNVYATINKVLTTRLTADTIGPIVSMAKFVYQILHNQGEGNPWDKAAFNVNIGVGVPPQIGSSDSRYPEGNPYRRPMRDVTPGHIAELEADIEELNILAAALGKGNKRDPEDE
jgi:hypothetical protein